MQATYLYDVNNQRIGKVANGTVERYVYDGSQIILTFSGMGGSPVARYLWGPQRDQLLAEDRITGPSVQVHWAFGDHLNTVRDVTNNLGQIQKHIAYDSFGNITNDTNPSLPFAFAFTGRLFDRNTLLIHNTNREYEPSTGRWPNEDPKRWDANEWNLYGYVGNDPLTNVDPEGLQITAYERSLDRKLSTPEGSKDAYENHPWWLIYGWVFGTTPAKKTPAPPPVPALPEKKIPYATFAIDKSKVTYTYEKGGKEFFAFGINLTPTLHNADGGTVLHRRVPETGRPELRVYTTTNNYKAKIPLIVPVISFEGMNVEKYRLKGELAYVDVDLRDLRGVRDRDECIIYYLADNDAATKPIKNTDNVRVTEYDITFTVGNGKIRYEVELKPQFGGSSIKEAGELKPPIRKK